jgi:hypothetical protein
VHGGLEQIHHLAEATTLLPGVTDYLLGNILQNQDATRRISKWAVKLGALNIDFKPRKTIKSQALVYFMQTGGRISYQLQPSDQSIG